MQWPRCRWSIGRSSVCKVRAWAGSSLATVAGLDHGYDRVFILLAGGNIDDVIFHGARDAAKVLEKLHAAGVTDDQIKDLTHQIEPMRWLTASIRPPLGSLAANTIPWCRRRIRWHWSRRLTLPADHHIEFESDHYLGIIYLPEAIGEIKKEMAGPADAHSSKD